MDSGSRFVPGKLGTPRFLLGGGGEREGSKSLGGREVGLGLRFLGLGVLRLGVTV